MLFPFFFVLSSSSSSRCGSTRRYQSFCQLYHHESIYYYDNIVAYLKRKSNRKRRCGDHSAFLTAPGSQRRGGRLLGLYLTFCGELPVVLEQARSPPEGSAPRAVQGDEIVLIPVRRIQGIQLSRRCSSADSALVSQTQTSFSRSITSIFNRLTSLHSLPDFSVFIRRSAAPGRGGGAVGSVLACWGAIGIIWGHIFCVHAPLSFFRSASACRREPERRPLGCGF